MFCKFKAETIEKGPMAETIYWLIFTNDITKTGAIHAKMPSNYEGTSAWHKKYESFEEFLAEWEIV
jgi:hypothetical protein